MLSQVPRLHSVLLHMALVLYMFIYSCQKKKIHFSMLAHSFSGHLNPQKEYLTVLSNFYEKGY